MLRFWSKKLTTWGHHCSTGSWWSRKFRICINATLRRTAGSGTTVIPRVERGNVWWPGFDRKITPIFSVSKWNWILNARDVLSLNSLIFFEFAFGTEGMSKISLVYAFTISDSSPYFSVRMLFAWLYSSDVKGNVSNVSFTLGSSSSRS